MLVDNWLGLGLLLALGKADNAAGNSLAHALLHDSFSELGSGALNLVPVVCALVEDNGTTDNGVGAAQVNKWVSKLVLSFVVCASLNLLEVTKAALKDIGVMVSLGATIWVPDITSGLTSVGQVAELVHLESVLTFVNSPELTDEASVVMGLLLKLKIA